MFILLLGEHLNLAPVLLRVTACCLSCPLQHAFNLVDYSSMPERFGFFFLSPCLRSSVYSMYLPLLELFNAILSVVFELLPFPGEA